MNPVKGIPNLLTIINLCCGIIGIIFALNGNAETACHLIWIAVVFDFADGFAARLLKAQSPIGKQLDSLADLVSFGVLPGFLYYQLLKDIDLNIAGNIDSYAFLIVPVLSALRLAKFNVDEKQSEEFIGLSTTAHAIFISALFISHDKFEVVQKIYESPYSWLGTMFIGSLLLVSPIRLFALKFKSFSFRENWVRYLILVLGFTFVLLFKEGGIALIIIAYILISVLFNSYRNKN